MQLWRKHGWWIITALLSTLFIWLRLYKIETSLLFFNDIGRDFLELWKWQQTGKPPLLGPQTSALPFNQSAVYFYLLMPIFLLTQGSLLATLYTLVIVYLGLFWLGVIWLRQKNAKLLPVFWALGSLLFLQPEMIIQQRFVWNPSFLVAWLLLTLLVSWQLLSLPASKWRWSWLWLWGLGLGLAVSFSYSAAPAFIAALLLAGLWWRWSAWKLWLPAFFSLALLNAPTFLFELRHSFLLTNMMLYGPWIEQLPSTLTTRYATLWPYFMGSNAVWAQGIWLLWLGLIVIGLLKQFWVWRQPNLLAQRSPLFLWTASWWLLTLLITLFLPVAVQSHYIFPTLLLGLASLAVKPGKLKWALIVTLLVVWLSPVFQGRYWLPARQTLSQLQDCSQKICSATSDPLFVSNQASAHPYHNAMEYQYLLPQAGCQLRDLANYPDSADQMVVVLDDSVYEHSKTAFNELTLFGASTETQRIRCNSKLEAVFLRKQR